ncbi:hypothetical protein WS70_02735 [Burkholderia mayonis]|uniref:Uncharacterized protein n=1 Tax=Burkholderia mayonis TaxID=1385591 RepID=A0A1B4FAZ8_9BURK|nr:hypothetical protein WS70_02735 [Burkholderia mayonis]KVE49721.1 hypothetical protein WS70_18170 [Burkholderia mayonis]
MLEALLVVGVVGIFGPQHGHLLAVAVADDVRAGAARVNFCGAASRYTLGRNGIKNEFPQFDGLRHISGRLSKRGKFLIETVTFLPDALARFGGFGRAKSFDYLFAAAIVRD